MARVGFDGVTKRFGDVVALKDLSLAIEDAHCQIFDVPTKPAGNVLQVIFHWRINIDDAAARWPNYNLVHVDIGGIEQAVAFGSRQDGDRIVGSQGTEIGALQRIDSNVYFRT